MVTETISVDANLNDSDWTKQSWDLPPYRSDEFDAIITDLEAFKKTPTYKFAVDNGLIIGDEWAGDDPPFPNQVQELSDRLVDRVEAVEKDDGTDD